MIGAPLKPPRNARKGPRKSCAKQRRFISNKSCLRRAPTAIASLGARRNATAAELRRNLALLCKWLHAEDREDSARSILLLRVTHAWNNLKTPERRAAYDATLNARLAALSAHSDRAISLAKDEKRNDKAKRPSRGTSGGSDGQARIAARKHRRGSLWGRLIAFALGARAH